MSVWVCVHPSDLSRSRCALCYMCLINTCINIWSFSFLFFTKQAIVNIKLFMGKNIFTLVLLYLMLHVHELQMFLTHMVDKMHTSVISIVLIIFNKLIHCTKAWWWFSQTFISISIAWPAIFPTCYIPQNRHIFYNALNGPWI